MLYVESKLAKNDYSSSIIVCESSKKLSKALLRRDYYQYFPMYAYDKRSELNPTIQELINVQLEDYIDLDYDENKNTLNVNYKQDIEAIILHTGWDISNINVSVKGKNVFSIKAKRQFNSRFIPAILFSCKEQYLEICDTFNNFKGELVIETEFTIVYK